MRRAAFLACVMLPGTAHAQTGGFVLGRWVTTEGSSDASTGFGAIDTGATSMEEAIVIEGRAHGFDWRVRAQSVGRTESFPGDADVAIKALSYGRQLTDTLFGSIGKQQRVFGAGVAYQPLGFFRTQVNLRDPTDAEGRGEGLPMLYLARLADPVTVEAIVADSLKDEPGRRQWAVRGSGQLGRLDLSALVRQRSGRALGVGASATWAGDRLGFYADLWWGPPERRSLVDDGVLGVDDAGHAIGRGRAGRRVSYAFGFTYTPVARLTFTTELHRRGEGLSSTDWRAFILATNIAASDVTTPRAGAAYRQLSSGLSLLSGAAARRDYLFERVAWSSGSVNLAVNTTIGLADGSMAATGVIGYAISSKLGVSCAATRFIGTASSEYGLSPIRTVVGVSIRRSFEL